ncbi:hypothetical protein CspeluHIS016_0501030 [Cutaneotrichosporon spelunceum]|uniref:Chitin-binding type-3 domain-containing protein n=1 Tax=Cutaneotrichosporon spelunceum TaxID=1672016 RepID=A0AAD3YCH4_9TREE|nr:hypothetical protein CspeluHIS016_0501030 [Cutaneotrichosporon spelunceum]
MKLAHIALLPLAVAAPLPGYRWWGSYSPGSPSGSSYGAYGYGHGHSGSLSKPEPVPQRPPFGPAPPSQPEPAPTLPAPLPTQPAPTQPEPPQDAGQDVPAVYQNATDWWVAGTVLHGKWRPGQWDGVDNTDGAVMYIDAGNVAVTVVPL